jgi:hypothetical protein
MKPPMAIRIYKGIGGEKESKPNPEKVDLLPKGYIIFVLIFRFKVNFYVVGVKKSNKSIKEIRSEKSS